MCEGERGGGGREIGEKVSEEGREGERKKEREREDADCIHSLFFPDISLRVSGFVERIILMHRFTAL